MGNVVGHPGSEICCVNLVVWLQKIVGNERAFLALLKERLCDDFKQECKSGLLH